MIAAGGGIDLLPGVPPAVITALTVPREGATGVPVSALPQVSFTEPVTGVSAGPDATVFLDEVGGASVPLKILGYGPDGVVPEVNASSRVTSITLQPLVGLKFGAEYRIRVTTALADLDTPPANLESEYSSSFTTFTPEAIPGQGDPVAIAGFAVSGDRAYVAETMYPGGTGAPNQRGLLKVFDISDPTEALPVGTPASILSPPTDLAYDEGIVAVTSFPRTVFQYNPVGYFELVSSPANLYLYDVRTDDPQWVGVASLSTGILDGTPQRVVLKGGRVYAATWRKGVQIVDVEPVTQSLPVPGSSAYFAMLQDIGIFGHGYGNENVVSIPVLDANQRPINLNDLKVAEVDWQRVVQPLVLATGMNAAAGLVITDAASVIKQQALSFAGSTLTYGWAVGFGVIGAKPIALVGGSGTGASGAANLLMVVDLSPLSGGGDAVVLAALELPATRRPSDILVTGTTAIVAAHGNAAVLVDLTTPSQARVVGEIAGVGSRLALTDANILLSTNRQFIAGTTNALQGLHAATLGRIALIERVIPKRIVVDPAKNAAEGFEVQYRVIPQGLEVMDARLELRSGEDTYAMQSVGMTNGSGAATFGLGTNLAAPAPGVRLVVNAGTEDEVIGRSRRLDLLGATIEPAAALMVSADKHEQPIALSSDSHLERSLDASEPESAQVAWEVLGAGGSIAPNPVASAGGRFEALLTTATTSGATYQVRAFLPGSPVLATTGLITVTPGRAKAVTLTADRTALPADEASEAVLTLTSRDQFGNLVADGTVVSWGVEGAGRVSSTSTATLGGVASTRYRAGDTAGSATVVARIDEVEAELDIDLAAIQVAVVPQAPIVVANASTPTPILITATSTAGVPDPAAELSVDATLGRIDAPPNLVNGEALAMFTPIGLVGQARLLASVTNHSGQAVLDVVRPAGLYAAAGPAVVIGDRTEDGTVEILDANGSPRTFTYRTATTVTVTGNPGDVIDLKLGGTRSPNVEPIAWYTMDEIEGADVVIDEYDDHHGRAQGGVSVDYLRRATGAASLSFDGSGRVEVQDAPALVLGGDLGVSAKFLAEVNQPATLVSKAGSWGLALAPAGAGVRVRAHVRTTEGEFETLSAPIGLDEWHSATALLENGVLRLRVDDTETAVTVSGSVVTAMGPLALGRDLHGNLDDVQVFDLTRPMILAFEDGSDTASVTLDGSGQAQVHVKSLGNLRTSSPNSWTSQLTTTLRSNFGVAKHTFIGALSLEVWVGIVELAGGFIEGDPDSIAGYVGDFAASLLIYGDVRDVGIALYRHWKGTATAGDYIVLVVAVIGLLTTLYPPADVFTAAGKTGAKLLRQLPPSVQRFFGVVIKDTIGELLSRGKVVFGAAKTQILRLVRFLAALTEGIVSLKRIAFILRDPERVRILIRLADESGDIVGMLNRLARVMNNLPYDEASKTRYMGELVDLLVHHADEAAELGLGVTKAWSDEALSGTVRFLHLTGDAGRAAGDLGRAKRLVEVALEGHKVGDFHGDVAEEFFRFVGKLPDPCPGCDALLGKGVGNGWNLQGAYGTVRLLADAPDLRSAGRVLETVSDRVVERNMKEGVDAIVRRTDVPVLPAPVRFGPGAPLDDRVPELWEMKYVRDISTAIKPDQVAKHLEDRVREVVRQLRDAGIGRDDIKRAMPSVRLKYDIILRNSPTGSVALDKQEVLRQLQAVLNQPRFKALRDTGFQFHIDDILLRHGDPIGKGTAVASLSQLAGP